MQFDSTCVKKKKKVQSDCQMLKDKVSDQCAITCFQSSSLFWKWFLNMHLLHTSGLIMGCTYTVTSLLMETFVFFLALS